MIKQKTKKRSHYAAVALSVFMGAAFLVGAFMLIPGKVAAAEIVVYKSPTCGCCKKWVSHMRKNGFTVEVHEQYNVTPVKDKLGVPRRLRSCHTAKVDGYIVEGHVPADVVMRLLEEKPQIAGVAVPGMPMGSPGMEGFRKDPYDIISFTDTGKMGIFASR
ncbi:MAG TPA: DUF411 domain-containing protein [Chromatiaceae bacterium]|nr:DUF411 domain-containing protein [Chromatiaceae bacterium]